MQKWNKVILPPRFIIPHQEKHHYSSQKKVPKESELKWYDCLTHETLRKRTWIMMVNWGIVALVYYGIGMSTTQLGGDIFLNFILAAVGEILGYCYNIAVMDFWGRKPTMVLGYARVGLICKMSCNRSLPIIKAVGLNFQFDSTNRVRLRGLSSCDLGSTGGRFFEVGIFA